MKRIAILGSTGSIGTQAIDIVRRNPDLYRAECLTAGTQVDLLIEQCRLLRPSLAVIADRSLLPRLHEALSPLGIKTEGGSEAIAYAASLPGVDMVLTATVGYSGLAPTIAAIMAGKDIALANKETLVVAGDLITNLLKSSRSKVYPVDSEHSAIYQCLQGEDPTTVKQLIITASGGPFRTMPQEQLAHVTAAQALRHPNWDMGAKITIDSATMLNKAFEIIEAHWLFGIHQDRISAVVHPQSIVHSMVEFTDGAIKAQLGVPDMHLPIAYALSSATRLPSDRPPLTLSQYASLTFSEPDTEKFPCLTLAHTAMNLGGNAACIINAANEVANLAFRQDQISFPRIYDTIAETLSRATFIQSPTLADYVASNDEARRIAAELIK